MKERVKQGVADFLNQVSGAAVTHEGRAGVAADDGTGERSGNEGCAHWPGAAGFGQVHAFVVAAKQDQRCLFLHQLAHGGVVGLVAGHARDSKPAGQAHLGFEEVFQTTRIGVGGHHGKAGRGKKVLRDRAPQVPHRLDGGVLFALDEGLGVQTQQLAELAQETRGAVQADRGLQVRAVQRFAEHAAELAVHADVDVSLDQARDLGHMAAQRKDHVDLGAYALHQAADFSDITGAVEVAVARTNDVDAWFFAGLAVLGQRAGRHFFHAVLGPQPVHGAVRALPLVFVDGARQKADQVGAFGRDAAANHLGDRAGHHHRRQVRVEHGVSLLHGAFGAFAAQLFFSQTGDHNG